MNPETICQWNDFPDSVPNAGEYLVVLGDESFELDPFVSVAKFSGTDWTMKNDNHFVLCWAYLPAIP